MDVKFDAMPQAERAIVYVRPVRVAELPADVQAKIGGLETVYSVNRTDGERLALVAMRTGKRPLPHVGGFIFAVGVVVLLAALTHEQAFA